MFLTHPVNLGLLVLTAVLVWLFAGRRLGAHNAVPADVEQEAAVQAD